MKRIFLIFILVSLITGRVNAQTSRDSIFRQEMILKSFADTLVKGKSDESRNRALAMFNPIFLDLLSDPATFNYPFDSLKAVSKLTSHDGTMRIYTWALQSLEQGTYTHFGIVQQLNPKTRKNKITGLTEKKYETGEAVNMELQPESWYGAIYYDIIEKRIKKKTYYFLLGWHGNDQFTTRKVIDVLFFDTWNKVCFGAPLFKDEKDKLRYRVVFEYASNAVMLLRYNRKKKAIVFDHLSPSNPGLKGQYRFYGPDFTYDGYFFRKSMWNYKSNLDLRNEK